MSRHVDEPHEISHLHTGEQLSLVAGYQSLNNHRAAFTGSMAMCSDEYFAWFTSKDNRKFCQEMIDWTLQESGVLRVSEIRHQKEGTVNQDGKNPENYFIEDRIEYFARIEQKTKGQWAPFNANDMQLDFVMLEPYIRLGLENIEEGLFYAKFRTPQRLGIFKFSVEYARHGLSYLHLGDDVSVIQWRHDAFPRFMHRAWPFYCSVFVLMASFFILVVSLLFGGDIKKKEKSA